MRARARSAIKEAGIVGFPRFNYRLPIVVTTLAATFLFLIMWGAFVLALSRIFTQYNRSSFEAGNETTFVVCICLPIGVVSLIGAIYFLIASIRGVRDLVTPVYYTRGTVASPGGQGRRNDAWLKVLPRYIGPDLDRASAITDDQVAASPDRSQIFNPRFESDTRKASAKSGGYLPSDRLSSQQLVEPDFDKPRIVFRTDPTALKVMDTGEEVLVAHSRHLQHVYYVAHLKGGEWESFRNRALI